MIFLWCVFCFTVGFVAVLVAWLVCACAWKLFWAALRRIGDAS